MEFHKKKNGQFSVSSGYKVAKLCKKKVSGEEGSSSKRENEDRKLWMGIWNMNITKKIQHFIWRVCHNRIPVNVNLRKRELRLIKRVDYVERGGKQLNTFFFIVI